MFETRLKVLLIAMGLGAAVLVVRLAELQIARGSAYRRRAARMMINPLEYIPAVRGRILDRNGYVLASEEPAWHISVHFGLISENPDYLQYVARTLKLSPAQTQQRVADLWRQLSRLSGVSTDEIELRRHRIRR